jgi:hypothetical protein
MGTGATRCRIQLLFLIYVVAGAVPHGSGRAIANPTGTTQTDFSDSATLIGMCARRCLWKFCAFFSVDQPPEADLLVVGTQQTDFTDCGVSLGMDVSVIVVGWQDNRLLDAQSSVAARGGQGRRRGGQPGTRRDPSLQDPATPVVASSRRLLKFDLLSHVV